MSPASSRSPDSLADDRTVRLPAVHPGVTPSPGGAAARGVDVLRGAAIGVVETIPGVSGATIALVVGVYERLLAAGHHLVDAVRGLGDVLRGRGAARSRAALRRVDLPLLVAIGVGMVAAVLVAARVVPPLLEAHPVGSNAVLFGMVLGSLAVPALAVGRPTLREVALGAVVAVAAFLLTGLPVAAASGEPALWLVLLAAAVAVCALALPGVSGSFVLLVIGLYEPTLRAVAEGDLVYVAVFATGAVIGLGAFVSVLTRLLARHRRAVMAAAAGLLLGALRALWPWQTDERTLLAPQAGDLVPVLLLGLAGAGVVLGVVALQHRGERRAGRAGTPADDVRTGPSRG